MLVVNIKQTTEIRFIHRSFRTVSNDVDKTRFMLRCEDYFGPRIAVQPGGKAARLFEALLCREGEEMVSHS